MNYVKRKLERVVNQAADAFPAVLLTGARRTGKTTLFLHLFPDAEYRLLEEADVVERARSDPRAFLDELTPPVILDEIQNVPELFTYIRARIDREPGRMGLWLLTGSQEAPLMQGVSDSMAGRVAVLSMMPLSLEESPRVTLFRGGFPEVLSRPDAADLWFRSYIQTYLERDVRAITSIRDLGTFRRFMALLASRCGQMLNKTEIAAPLGVSVPTLTQWLNILEITGQILLVQPYHRNFGKRLVKSPKLYFLDSGMACALLGIRDESSLRKSVFHGPLFEGWVASELLKHRLNRALDRGLYWFRDRQGLEVDFILEDHTGQLLFIEAKASQTVRTDDASPLLRLKTGDDATEVTRCVVYQSNDDSSHPLCPGVRAVGMHGLHDYIDG